MKLHLQIFGARLQLLTLTFAQESCSPAGSTGLGAGLLSDLGRSAVGKDMAQAVRKLWQSFGV